MRIKSNLKVLALSVLFASSFAYAEDKPLLMEGKETLYQRVLTTPDCVLKASADAQDGKAIPAFSRYYVYGRDEATGTIKVGADLTGKIAGYLDSKCTIDWKMQMALLFTNPADRNRTLIFDTFDNLDAVVNAEDPKAITDPLYASLKQTGKAQGVVATEPETYIDYTKQFYLLPILESTENMFYDGFYVRELKIASVTEDQKSKAQAQKAQPQTSAITSFKAAIVFVIDSSISMQPYIDRTKKGIEAVYKRLEQEGLEDSVSFGLVSFRSNTKAVPGLEYTSKLYVNPGEVNNAEDFAHKVQDLNQAKVSSALFDEDVYSGLNTALSDINWSQFGGRYIVLITDAGAIEGSNKLSTTGLDARELRLEAEHQGAAIYALHLLTNAGKKSQNHDKAKTQYEDLTFNQVLQKPLYYPVNAGDVNEFGQRIDELAASIASQVRLSSEGKIAAGSAAATPAPTATPQNQASSLEEDTKKLGLAMQLRYLGTVTGTKTPTFLEGYVADRDLVYHEKPTSTPVVLLTKAQLSDLKDVVSGVMEAANEGMLSPYEMFQNIRSLAASLGRDPSRLSEDQSFKIAESGLLGEYLDDLPYKSEIANIDEAAWAAMAPQEQDALIRSLESKLRYYQVYNDDVDRWIDLVEGADKSEAVYPVPLEALP